MAAKRLLKIPNVLLLSKFSAFIEQTSCISRPLLCYQQTRGKRHLKPRMKNGPCPWLVKKRAPLYFTYVSDENKAFLKEAVQEQYKNLPSPFRDEPWSRNEWTEK